MFLNKPPHVLGNIRRERGKERLRERGKVGVGEEGGEEENPTNCLSSCSFYHVLIA